MGQEKLHQCFAEFVILHIRSNCGDIILREVDACNLCLAKAKRRKWRVLDHDASESVSLCSALVLRVLPSAVNIDRMQRVILLVASQ
jgi:hypothetical protein